MKHLVLDCETLDVHVDGIILQFCAGIYDTTTNEPNIQDGIDVVTYKLDGKTQTMRRVDGDTFKWWKGQPESLKRQVLYPTELDIHPEKALDDFCEWLKQHGWDSRNDVIWQRGSMDVDWIRSLMRDFGYTNENAIPLKFYRVRDMRTLVDVLGMSSKLNGYPDNTDELTATIPGYKHHDAESDVRFEFAILRSAGVL